MAKPEAQAPVKKNLYTEEEIAALAAYVASLGPGPAIPTEEEYDPVGLSEEDLARGGELFRTNCSACHNFEGAGGALPNGKYAPSPAGRQQQAPVRGDADRPAADAGVLRRGDAARGQAGHHRLPERAARAARATAAWRWAASAR